MKLPFPSLLTPATKILLTPTTNLTLFFYFYFSFFISQNPIFSLLPLPRSFPFIFYFLISSFVLAVLHLFLSSLMVAASSPRQWWRRLRFEFGFGLMVFLLKVWFWVLSCWVFHWRFDFGFGLILGLDWFWVWIDFWFDFSLFLVDFVIGISWVVMGFPVGLDCFWVGFPGEFDWFWVRFSNGFVLILSWIF